MKSKNVFWFVILVVCLVWGCVGLCGDVCGESGVIVFDFESGGLGGEGWSVVEGENSKAVGCREFEYNRPAVPYAKHGKFYLTTLETISNDRPTDDTICTLESPAFIIQGTEAKLLVGGGRLANTYVGLCPILNDGAIGKPVRKAHGQNNENLTEIVWDVADLQNKTFVLQVVDKESGSWSHIRMDNFRVNGTIDTSKSNLRKKYLNDLAVAEKTKLNDIKKHPLITENPILYVTRQQYRPDHHNTATLFQNGEINTASFRGGSSLRVWNPKDDSIKILLEVPNGIVRDPCLSFDATKLLVSIRRDIKDDYHIYELQLTPFLNNDQPKIIITSKPDSSKFDSDKPDFSKPDSDANTDSGKFESIKTASIKTVSTKTASNIPASNKPNSNNTDSNSLLRQLTFLSGVSDIDPLYLPSGEIIFSATREPKYCMCNRHIMANLYKMNGDGSNIRQIGKSTLFEGHASLMPDGRVIYDRWEYVDRNFADAQGVWITTADGFNHSIFWGNNTTSPDGVIDARILPDSSSVFVATFTSCHDRPWGAIAIVDRQRGIDGKQAVLQTWPPSAIDLVDTKGYDAFMRVNPKFEDPFPLSADWFLAAGTFGEGEKTGIYLLGRDGTMQLVHKDSAVQGCFDPTPIKPVTPPPINTQEADLKDPNGYFYVINVYEGFGMNLVKKGDAKFLRVIESPEKQTWSPEGWDNGTGQQAPGMAWKDFNNKRILGTVPIEDDGSVFVSVPADTFVYFQILDEQGRMIQTMRSGVVVRPGEKNGCVGCHEDRLAAVPALSYTPKALAKSPAAMNGWYGEPRLFSYVKEVQEPVFDKYCVTCHDYNKNDNPKMPILAGDLNTIFNASYVELHSRGLVKAVGAGTHVKLNPYTWGSTKSKLANVLINGHDDPKVDEKRKQLGIYFNRTSEPELVDRVITWIDLNAPYYGTYLTSFPKNRYGRSPLERGQWNKLSELTGMRDRKLDWSISFTRPELSGCLSKWKTGEDKNSTDYKEALAIIVEGKNNLAKTPRGESPNIVSIPPNDTRQTEKYNRLKSLEKQMRNAVINNIKLYETETGKLE
ncbi:MAG: hypothetical protein LBQ66_07110 [Planctomycetaceae bacterium]|jgi:hypothetical protein|nr:hypothetical protein [Planctomycetaceae bacterium]